MRRRPLKIRLPMAQGATLDFVICQTRVKEAKLSHWQHNQPESGRPRPISKGFGLKAEVQGELASDYSGRLVDLLRERRFRPYVAGETTVRLAREFGFCYGVERAVEYAYQTRRKFPGPRVFLAGEIIHNPHVNTKLREMGVEILETGPTASTTAWSSRRTS